eukprot:scaffold33455_cov112-Isochrysis_galbana.AAC.2
MSRVLRSSFTTYGSTPSSVGTWTACTLPGAQQSGPILQMTRDSTRNRSGAAASCSWVGAKSAPSGDPDDGSRGGGEGPPGGGGGGGVGLPGIYRLPTGSPKLARVVLLPPKKNKKKRDTLSYLRTRPNLSHLTKASPHVREGRESAPPGPPL